ncbi:MAG: carboxypeptidase regulatory-like domain-containing protein [Terriglobales bacterium]
MRGFPGWRPWLLRLFLAVQVLLACPYAGWAQVSAAISGKIEDASGAAVSGATVTVKDVETGATRVVATDSTGNYRVLSLPIGRHELRVEKEGFRVAVRTGIKLDVGEEAVVNLHLAVGQAVQEITVSEETPVVNTTTASVSGLVGEREIKNLPLNGRGFDKLITLNPGTVNYSALRSSNTTTSNGSAFAVDGQRPGDNQVLLNGVEYAGSSQLAVTPGGVSGSLMGIDAVREFNVLTENYGVEYGKREGAQVTVVTQSGSNTPHGTLYEFVRNSVLDGRNYFDQGSIPPFQQNQFGGSVGGPIKKNRLFLFGNYEGFRQSLSVSSESVVPDTCARQLLNNCVISNPSAEMLPYMSFWPQPNGAQLGGGEALSFNHPEQSIREDFGTLRADYILSQRDTLSGTYTIDDGNGLIPLADPLFASALALRSQVISLQETHILSPRILNTFTAGFSRAGFANNSSPYVSFPANLSFVQGRGPGGIVIGGGVTTTANGAITSAGPNNASSVWNRRNLFTFTNNLQISRGIHQISLGIWLQPLQDNEDTASRQLGQASFTSLAAFLQGMVGAAGNSFQVVPTAAELGWRSLMGAWYVQDAIKLRPNLTLEVGLRHEFDTGWNEEAGRAANFVTDANGLLVTTPRIGDSAFMQNNAKRLFSPRVALAWDPHGNGTTVFHAGFGIHYSLLDALAFQLNSVPQSPPSFYNGSISLGSTKVPVSLPSIVPLDPNGKPAPQCSGGPGSPPGCTIYAPQGVQANAKIPTLEEWNLTFEQQLDRSTVLRIGYVGSFGYHQIVSIDPNSVVPAICSIPNPPGCTAGGIGKATSTVGPGTEYIPVVSSRPNPNLSSGFFWYTEANSSYNGLQVDVSRRFTRKLQFRANYTWSKSLDVNSAPTGAQANNQAQMVLDRFDLRKDWGPSALNVAHQAHFTATYELPFGHGQYWLAHTGGVAGGLVSGWVFNTITTLMSGFPLTPQAGSNVSGDGDTRNPDRPSLNASFSGPIVLGSPNQWFNPNAFMATPAGTYGDLGRGTLTGPRLVGMDVSLFKNTNITEKIALQFRAEFFNVLNHTNFDTPNLTVFSGGKISPSAGLITATATSSRQIQFGLKLIY